MPRIFCLQLKARAVFQGHFQTLESAQLIQTNVLLTNQELSYPPHAEKKKAHGHIPFFISTFCAHLLYCWLPVCFWTAD